MRKRIFLVGAFCFLMLIINKLSFAQFDFLLNVPLYGQDTWYYCGAASAQMMMMGYPNPADNSCQGQIFIYNRIQAHKQDNGFYSDPDGLRDTVMELNSPPGTGRYNIFHNTDRDIVMHDILFWMAKRNYPTATLINHGAHWVVITGFQTDRDPRLGDAILQMIDINDPAPQDFAPHDDPCTSVNEGNEGGTVRHVTGTSWYSNDWIDPNSYGTKWLNEYVAIVEPPRVLGRVTAQEEKFCGKVISPERAIELALQHVKERKLYEKKPFWYLKETYPRRAFLTNKKYKGYYVVPFEFKKEKLSPGAILLNAYTGEFQEIGAFPRPLEFLSEEEAIQIAICSVRKKPTKPPLAELMFKICEQTRSRYRPIWKVSIPMEKITIIRYVSQLGQIYLELTSPLYGGD